MPIRPRQHVLEDLAHAALSRAVVKAGWTVEPISKDYGEDFLIRIFDKGAATPWTLFVQSKSTDSIARYLSKDATTLSYPIETRHLIHWERFWEPVVLTVYDSTSKKTYWRVVQPWLEQLPEARRKRLATAKTSHVSIPTNNLLNASGLARLSAYTKNRFDRFRREQEGANHLVECLKDAIGLEVDYDAQAGVLLIPDGSFQKGNGGSQCYFFGRVGALLMDIARKTGKSEEDVLNDSILNFVEKMESMSKAELSKQKRDWLASKDA